MSRIPQNLVNINQLVYEIPNSCVQFNEINIAFGHRKYGIVGDNGIGKSTLFKLILGQIQPTQGSIQRNIEISYCPQRLPLISQQTIAEVLGIAQTLKALQNIENGYTDPTDFETVGNNWDIEAKVNALFVDFGLSRVKLTDFISMLSGGEVTKLLLVKALLNPSNLLLLDEPTNNLDSDARKHLYQWVHASQQAMLIISHDRKLLNLVDEIIEITTKGINRYGGNYDFYCQQKEIEQAALQSQLVDAKQSLRKTQSKIQKSREKHEKRKSKGRKAFLTGKIDRLTANSMRGRSEKTKSKMVTQENQLMTAAQRKIEETRSKLEIKEQINLNLSATKVANNKLVLDIEDLQFSYSTQSHLFDHFNLKIIGPERIAILGPNGSGKTTLVKLIQKQLKPQKGVIKLGIQFFCYFDQNVDFLFPELTLIENFQKLNPDIGITDAYFALASFNFRNNDANKLVKHLSGGERIRAGLAISLLSKTPPQLIILDEPTNHLDLSSIEAIESIIKNYLGAIIVISHDQQFLENIAVKRLINLG